MARPKKKGLGKGLGALIGAGAGVVQATGGATAPLSDGAVLLELNPRDISPNPWQPRRSFDEESLAELAASIRQDGVQEPVVVRMKEGRHELVSGERRVRASVLAEQETVPAILRDVSDKDMLRLGLIENIQREDLNPIETAEAYQKLLDEFHWTQEVLATQVGKQRVTVTNVLRLLNLPASMQGFVREGRLTAGHARALLTFDSPADRSAACKKIMAEGLSVRQAEKLASLSKAKADTTPKTKDPHITEIEEDLQRRYGTRVRMRANAKNRGKIEIEFYGLDDLERILGLLKR